ncbi:MAG TPA: CsgG/HfaB family protein [Dokdonella sp.]
MSRAHRSANPPRRRWRRLAWACVGACVLIAAAGTACAGESDAKPVLGVLKLQDETGAMPFQGGIGRVLTNILTNELAARPRFTVVERRRLQAILEEQELGASGRLRPGEGARIGELSGADYLVMGTVTAFEEGVEKTSRRAFLGGVGGGRRTSTAYLALDLRVVDTSTGEIAHARTIEGRTTKTASSVDVGFGGAGLGYESIKSEATAKVVRAAVIEVIDYLECAMVRRDGCLAVYAGKEQQRVDGTRKAIRLDGNTR